MRANVPLFTSKERKAMQAEIDRQIAQNVKNLSSNLQALVLWSLHEQLGFGKKRLLEFQKNFLPLIKELQNFYEATSAKETEFICKYKLKNGCGIDVDELGEMFEIQAVLKK